MVFNQLWENPDLSTDVHCGCGVWHLDGIKDRIDSFVRLQLFRNMRDTQRARVERILVLWRTEPILAKLYHFAPIDVHQYDDKRCDEIADSNGGVKTAAFHVPNGEDAENIRLPRVDLITSIIHHVDRDEHSAC